MVCQLIRLSENVSVSFNKDIITKLLRNKYKFEGVCTDWGLISDSLMGCGSFILLRLKVQNHCPKKIK
ncbi:MAG: hypothetical protein IPO48_09130 [Saprospiraceae bacterium]|nr:hypothetical protein [Saprospiraceae bacterium]